MKTLLQLIWVVTLILPSSSADQVPLVAQYDNLEQLSSGSILDLISLHRTLIEIDSTTGREKEVGDWLSSYLEQRGLTVEKQHISDDRFNLFAYPGASNKTELLVSSHIDTVPPFIPYRFVKPNQIWGRGSVDAKAAVAAQTIAVLDVLNSHKENSSATASPPSVALLFVVGEETSGQGMKFFSDRKPTNYSAVVFGEPTEAKLATGHKGMISFTLEVKGRAAHSGYPWLGLSATDVLVKALYELRALERELPHSPTLGQSTINIGKIDGGVAANVVAEHASAMVSIRIAAGTPRRIERLVSKAFEHVKVETQTNGGVFNVTFSDRAYGPVHLDTDIVGFDKLSVNYGTDVPNLKGDHKRYLYGPGSILVAHGPDEHLTTDEMVEAVLAYKKIIMQLLRRV